MTVHRRFSNPGPGAPAGSRLALVLSLILAGPGLLSGPVNASTERVNVSSSGKQANDGSYYGPALSGDGRFVVFESPASNLVPGDGNRGHDIFVHDRVTGTTERVNVSPSGAEANGGIRCFGNHPICRRLDDVNRCASPAPRDTVCPESRSARPR